MNILPPELPYYVKEQLGLSQVFFIVAGFIAYEVERERSVYKYDARQRVRQTGRL